VTDRELHGKREQRADMVTVIVGRPQVIDPRDTCGVQRVNDATEVAVPGMPVSTSSDSPEGPMKSVDCPPSVSM
jgi:hypothetical protein